MLFFGEPILGQPKISSFRAFAMNRAADEVARVARQVVNRRVKDMAVLSAGN